MTLAEGIGVAGQGRDADVVIGEDWDHPADTVESELSETRRRRGILSLRRSPLARKIILFNLVPYIALRIVQ